MLRYALLYIQTYAMACAIGRPKYLLCAFDSNLVKSFLKAVLSNSMGYYGAGACFSHAMVRVFPRQRPEMSAVVEHCA